MKKLLLVIFSILLSGHAFGFQSTIKTGNVFQTFSYPHTTYITDAGVFPGVGIGDITHDRNYVQWYRDSADIYQVSEADTASIDYNGGSNPLMLVERAATNLFEGSSVFGADQAGSELLTNGDASDDTYTDSSVHALVGCGNDGTHNAANKFLITGGAFRLISDGTSMEMNQSGLAKGKVYSYSINIIDVTSGGVELRTGSSIITYTTTGVKTGLIISEGTAFILKRGSIGVANDITFDDVSIVEVGGTQLDPDGTSEGTFKTGNGVGAKNYRTGGAWVNDAISGMDGTGGTDDESYFEVVSDTAKIATATPDLSNAVASGKTIKFVAGASAAFSVDFAGALTAADHTIHAYVRGASAADDDVKFRTDNVDGNAQDLTDEYAWYGETVTALNGDLSRLEIAAGDTIYVTFFQTELGSAATSSIITQDAAATRAADDVRRQLAGNFNQSQGMVCYTLIFGADAADFSGDSGIFGTRDNATSVLSYDGTNFSADDGTNTADKAVSVVAGTEYDICVGWSPAGMQITVDGSSGTASAYDGAFTTDGNDEMFYGAATAERILFGNPIEIYDLDRGASWRESHTQ